MGFLIHGSGVGYQVDDRAPALPSHGTGAMVAMTENEAEAFPASTPSAS